MTKKKLEENESENINGTLHPDDFIYLIVN